MSFYDSIQDLSLIRYERNILQMLTFPCPLSDRFRRSFSHADAEANYLMAKCPSLRWTGRSSHNLWRSCAGLGDELDYIPQKLCSSWGGRVAYVWNMYITMYALIFQRQKN